MTAVTGKDGLLQLLDPLDRRDDVRQADPELLIHHDDLASRDELLIHEHFERLTRKFREFDHRSLGKRKDVADRHPSSSQLDRDLQRNIEDEIEGLHPPAVRPRPSTLSPPAG